MTAEQVGAYVALTRADQARDAGDAETVRRAYVEALGLYVSIRDADPRWHPDVVRYRLSYCANELEKLGRPAAEGPVPPPSAAPEEEVMTAAVPPVVEEPPLVEEPPPAAPPLPEPVVQPAVVAVDVVSLEHAAKAEERVAKLEEHNAALRETIDLQAAEMARVRALKKELREAKSELRKTKKELEACRESVPKQP